MGNFNRNISETEGTSFINQTYFENPLAIKKKIWYTVSVKHKYYG